MKLIEARFLKKWTQSDLSLLTGFSTTKISLLENGYRIPSEKERAILAEALEINSTELEFELKNILKGRK